MFEEIAPRGEATVLHEMLLRVFWRLLAWLAGGRLPAARFDFAFESPAPRSSASLAVNTCAAESAPRARGNKARTRAKMLAAALPLIGHEAIRSRGTIGGSLAHADPAAELPAVARALDAEFVVRGPSSERVIPAAEWFEGRRPYLELALDRVGARWSIRFNGTVIGPFALPLAPLAR